MKAGTCLHAPSDENLRAEALGCPEGQVDQCPGQQDVVDLHMDGQDTDFPTSGKELSRWVAQLESDMKGREQMISELRGTVDELAETVAKRKRHAQRHPAKSEDKVRQHKEEQKRLHARVAASEAELVPVEGHLSNKSLH